MTLTQREIEHVEAVFEMIDSALSFVENAGAVLRGDFIEYVDVTIIVNLPSGRYIIRQVCTLPPWAHRKWCRPVPAMNCGRYPSGFV